MNVAIAVLALLAGSQPITSVPGPEIEVTEQKEVAYEALMGGQADRAIAQLEARLVQEPEDPALLINLGAAYAQLGRTERAAAAYEAVLDSSTRYDMELADGRWVDSRRVARMALRQLGSMPVVASR